MQTYVPNNQNYQNVQSDNLNYDDNSFDLDNYDILEDDIQF